LRRRGLSVEVAGDGYFVDRMGYLAVFHPESRGAAGVVSGDGIDALAHQFADDQTAFHAAPQRVETVGVRRRIQIMDTAGIAGALQTELARRITAEHVAR